MKRSLEARIWERAGGLCEYCMMSPAFDDFPFEVDHIIALMHGGKTQLNNLALTCSYCNRYKGPNLSGWDLKTRRVLPLFHPRKNAWPRHFRWNGPYLLGTTPTGRVTVRVLRINHPLSVRL